MMSPSDDRLVTLTNLTGHAIQVDDVTPGAAPGSAITVNAVGGRALVTEPVAGEGVLGTVDGWLREVLLWRSEEIEGLPAPSPGVRYLVSRLTALAARDRDDLVFPTQEHRDAGGAITGARALGRFMSERPPLRASIRPPLLPRIIWAAIGRRRPVDWGDVPAVNRRIGVIFAVATALLGAALGTAPSATGDDPRRAGFWPMLGVAAFLAVAGSWALWSGKGLWEFRERLLTQRGSVYVVNEQASSWTYEEKRGFLHELSRHFQVVLQVPGPGELGEVWHWPLDEGASRWSEKVDALVRSFWSVHYNDDPTTDNSVLIWTWWPVGLAFGARATACRRGLTLHLRQRPSHGRTVQVDTDGWHTPALTFTGQGEACLGAQGATSRPVTLTVTARSGMSRSALPLTAAAPVTILLVRLLPGSWNTLTPETPPTEQVHLEIDDAAGIGVVGSVEATLREWRWLPGTGGEHAWDTFPDLARSAVKWIAESAAEAPGVVLLATLIPQEIGVGMGVLAAARPKGAWPSTLWPIQVDPNDPNHLLIPGLDLGLASLRRLGGEPVAV